MLQALFKMQTKCKRLPHFKIVKISVFIESIFKIVFLFALNLDLMQSSIYFVDNAWL